VSYVGCRESQLLIDDSERKRDASGRYAPQHSVETRRSARHDYELTDMTIEAIADKHGVWASTINEWARDDCWVRRRPRRIDPNDLLSRMLGLLDVQMTKMESAVNGGELEVAMLAKVVTTLDKVLLVKERTAAAEPPKSSKRADELRAMIAERIRELNRG
jgi:hypothetical protein